MSQIVDAYRRNDAGVITPTAVVLDQDGYQVGTAILERTDEVVQLQGWEHARARVYKTVAGAVILIPEEAGEGA